MPQSQRTLSHHRQDPTCPVDASPHPGTSPPRLDLRPPALLTSSTPANPLTIDRTPIQPTIQTPRATPGPCPRNTSDPLARRLDPVARPDASPTCTDNARLPPASPTSAGPSPTRAVDPCRRLRPGWRSDPCDDRADQRPPTWSRLATCRPPHATPLADGWIAAPSAPRPLRPQRPAGSTPPFAVLRDHRRRGWTHDRDIRPAADREGRPIRADQRHRARGRFDPTGDDGHRSTPWPRPLDRDPREPLTGHPPTNLERSRD